MSPQHPDKPAAVPADGRLVTAERSHQGHSAVGTVLLRQGSAPDAGASPHLKLAGSRAWLSLGKQRLAAEDWTGALACAQAGLDELGTHYASHKVIDDTGLKLLAAEEQLKRGNVRDAAAVKLRMLETRTRLYAELHADTVAE